jgi:hypothetical protein
MNGPEQFEVPPALMTIPPPWNHTFAAARRRDLDRAGWSRSGRTDALGALITALEVLPGLPIPADADVPSEFADYFDFTAQWFAEAMPMFESVSLGRIREMVTKRAGAAPTEQEVSGLAALWILTMVLDVVRSAVDWLTAPGAQNDGPAAESANRGLVDLVRRELPRQSNEVAETLLNAVAGLGQEAADLLAHVATDERAPDSVREHARSLQIWRRGRPARDEEADPS